jgi:hypothetical protein
MEVFVKLLTMEHYLAASRALDTSSDSSTSQVPISTGCPLPLKNAASTCGERPSPGPTPSTTCAVETGLIACALAGCVGAALTVYRRMLGQHTGSRIVAIAPHTIALTEAELGEKYAKKHLVYHEGKTAGAHLFQQVSVLAGLVHEEEAASIHPATGLVGRDSQHVKAVHVVKLRRLCCRRALHAAHTHPHVCTCLACDMPRSGASQALSSRAMLGVSHGVLHADETLTPNPDAALPTVVPARRS